MAALHSVFVYGSLQSRAVLSVLLGSRGAPPPERMLAATLRGFRRFAIRERVYPAVVPEALARKVPFAARATVPEHVRGLLLLGLDDEQLRRFDQFEDEDYTREEVTVRVDKTQQDHSAYAYVWKDSALGLLEGPWSYEDKFLPVEAEYVANCQRFVAAGFSWEQGTFCDFDAGGGGAASPASATGGDRVAIRDVKPKSPGGSPGRSS